MRRGSELGKLFTTAGTLLVAVLLYASFCATARAEPVPVRFQHGGEVGAYETLDVCRDSGCTRYAAPCAVGAACAITADLAPGTHEVWLVARIGERASLPSNRRTLTVAAPPPPFDPVACSQAPDFWRADFDGSGTITTADFGRFFRQFGTSAP